MFCFFFFFQAEDGIRDWSVTGVQTCALPIFCCRHRDCRTWSPAIVATVIRLCSSQTTARAAAVSAQVRLPSRQRQRRPTRSEERRVGKECRCRWWADQYKKEHNSIKTMQRDG